MLSSINIAPYRKTIVAVIGGLAVVSAAVTEAVVDGNISIPEMLQIVTAVGTVLGVYQVPNATPLPPPPPPAPEQLALPMASAIPLPPGVVLGSE